MVGEADLAEELMQETFVRAYNNRNNLRDDAKLAAWIFGIARNIALNALRSRRMAADKMADDDHAEMEVADKEPSPDQAVAQQRTRSRYRKSSQNLNRRQTFGLYAEGPSAEEL